MKVLKIISISLLLGLLSTSCLVDDEVKTDVLKETPLVIGFSNTTASFSYFQDIGIVEREVPVEVIGGQAGFTATDVQATFEIDPSSTAVEGQEFTLPEGKTIKFSANRDLTFLKIGVNTASLNPTSATFVKLNIVATDGLVADAVKKSVVVSFIGCKTKVMAGSYNNPTLPTIVSGSNADIVEIEPNTFETIFPRYTLGGNLIKFQFNDTCGELMITGSSISDRLAITADSAVFDEANNTITFTNMVIHTTTDPTSPPAAAPIPTSTYTKN